MPLDLPTSNRFCTFVASKSSFRKRSRTLGCIFVSDVGIIDCTCSCDRSSNLRRVAEDSNVMLFFSSFFSSCSSSSSFLSRLVTDAASLWRNSLFIARTPGLWTICRSGMVIGLKCLSNAMSSSILPVFKARCFLRKSTRSYSRSPSRFFHARTHQSCLSLAKYWQWLITLWYRELVKSFSVSPVFKRTVLVYH